jgi:diamine N-acetyltransferase
MAIRRAIPADAAELSAFARRTFIETFGEHNRAEDMDVYLARTYSEAQQRSELADENVVTLISESDGAMNAFAQMRRGPAAPCVNGPAPIEVVRFYVDQSSHGRGLAHELMQAVLDTARSLNAQTIWLGVWERNDRAIAFYKKKGFATVGSQPFILGSDVQTDLVMMRGIA